MSDLLKTRPPPLQIGSFQLKRLVHNYGGPLEYFHCSSPPFKVTCNDTDQSAARDCRIVFHSISDKRVSCTFTTCAEHLQTVICFKLLNECLIEFNFVAHWPKVNIWIFCYVNLWYLRRYFTSVNETEVFFINLVFTGALFCHHISSFFGLPNLKQKESKDNTYNYSKPAL